LLKLWNIKTNECVGTFDKHDEKTWALCVSKDESKIISGGADGKLIIWKDVTNQKNEEDLEKKQEILLQ
jgi:U3 small nucleolar RNA-associated protein 13